MVDSAMSGTVTDTSKARRQFLAISNVSKSFQIGADQVLALRNVNLNINKGEFVCLIGASGCGKSTLLRIIAGFEQTTSGQVSLYENAITGPGSDRGMVFQNYALFPHLTVRENIAFGPRQKGLAKKYIDEITNEYLNMVGLEKFSDRFPQQLSGGMKQRVAIARVLANECELLLMDEPFGALDALTRESLQQELLDIWARTQVTVIFVTHSVEEAVLLSDRVVVMTAGPGRVEADIAIELARPRDVSAIDFNQVRRDITQRLTSHVAPREVKAVA